MIHALITLAFIAICFVLKLHVLIYLIPVGFYLGREIAQAEYRYIEMHGGVRSKCPLLCGLKPEAWTTKSVCDCMLPLAAALVSIALTIFLRGF